MLSPLSHLFALARIRSRSRENQSAASCVAFVSLFPIGVQEIEWNVNVSGHHEAGYSFQGYSAASCIAWRRYVDDILVCPRRYCRRGAVGVANAGLNVTFFSAT